MSATLVDYQCHWSIHVANTLVLAVSPASAGRYAISASETDGD